MKHKKVPLRKCVACQEMKPKKTLIRVVRTPDSGIKFDPTGKASGRGAYICHTNECFQLARKNRSLERSLKTNIDEDVYASLQTQLGQ
ncbi:RNase P modulator RnpM [Caldalkalibacillus salinus]|uniref:RNase P modulator RnpM n=1 Tax=Caldalkalibacillus salinus TaxID=2803787 RepID=UPI00192087C2|nr:YlxR family protein [Caldalkalibacillus salinus]